MRLTGASLVLSANLATDNVVDLPIHDERPRLRSRWIGKSSDLCQKILMNAGKNGILFGKNCQISISSKGTMKCI